MIEHLTPDDIHRIHDRAIAVQGGINGTRDEGAVQSAASQPHQTFGGVDLYPTLIEKVAALGFSLVRNHAFVDGNKRVAHAAMDFFLMLNGCEIHAPVDEQEAFVLGLADGSIGREDLVAWLERNVVPIADE